MSFILRIGTAADFDYADEICEWYKLSAQERGTGIAQRTASYLRVKLENGDAVLALDEDTDRVVGFCYIENFSDKQYVSNSGLIVHRDFRGHGLARRIKRAAFDLARAKYPRAKIFGITTSDAVMKINSELGYRPTAFPNLTQDEAFWRGCSSCRNYDILMRNDKRMCLCTGMIAEPAPLPEPPPSLFDTPIPKSSEDE